MASWQRILFGAVAGVVLAIILAACATEDPDVVPLVSTREASRPSEAPTAAAAQPTAPPAATATPVPPPPPPTAPPAPPPTIAPPPPTPGVEPTIAPPPPPAAGNCDPSYPGVCIPPAPPDLSCKDVLYTDFTVLPPDPHGFDGNEDGVGCES